MVAKDEHAIALQGLYNQLKPVIDFSEQAIYLYLDDVHKICNANFASLLGYESPEEWANIETSFPDTFADEGSQNVLVSTYQDAMQKSIGSTVDIAWKNKSGDVVNTSVILVPISYQGKVFALHFISAKE
ncbi:MAG TPA: hypothetical protein VKM55_27100 [Candidatus Lokiarchaeia archaeon]|nr:hypothetical protein [Candidatus Lokiarchaeia archaeon]